MTRAEWAGVRERKNERVLLGSLYGGISQERLCGIEWILREDTRFGLGTSRTTCAVTCCLHDRDAFWEMCP